MCALIAVLQNDNYVISISHPGAFNSSLMFILNFLFHAPFCSNIDEEFHIVHRLLVSFAPPFSQASQIWTQWPDRWIPYWIADYCHYVVIKILDTWKSLMMREPNRQSKLTTAFSPTLHLLIFWVLNTLRLIHFYYQESVVVWRDSLRRSDTTRKDRSKAKKPVLQQCDQQGVACAVVKVVPNGIVTL